jgi:hypothetical protein
MIGDESSQGLFIAGEAPDSDCPHLAGLIMDVLEQMMLDRPVLGIIERDSGSSVRARKSASSNLSRSA